jgi:hypothetical protein
MSSPRSGSDHSTGSGNARPRRRTRGRNQKPSGRYTITEIAPCGTPILPRLTAGKWRTACGSVTRQRVPLTVDDWRAVPESTRTVLLDEILAGFIFEEEHRPQLRRAAIKACNKAWKEFKYILRRDFISKGLEPFGAYPHLNPEEFEAFKAMCSTEEFKMKSEAAKQLAAKNKHHHRLGSAGYAGKERKWVEEEERARLTGAPIPFPTLVERRSRNWALARSTDGKTASTVETQQVLDRMVRRRLRHLYKIHACPCTR